MSVLTEDSSKLLVKMALKDILEKKKKKMQTPLRVNIVEVLDNFTIVRDESDFAVLKNDKRLMKHLAPEKGLLIPKARLDPRGYLTLSKVDLEPCKIGKMCLKDNQEDKKTIEALRKKIEQFDDVEESNDSPSFEQITQKGLKRIPRICLYVLHIGKECKGQYGNFKVLVVLDRTGQKSRIFVNHLKVLDSLKEAPGSFIFKEIEVAKTDDFTLKTTVKTTIEVNLDFDFDTVQIGEHQIKATLYHFHEPRFFENNDFKVELLFVKEDDKEKIDGVEMKIEEDAEDEDNIGNVSKKLKLDIEGTGCEDDDDDDDEGSDRSNDEDGTGKSDDDEDDSEDFIRIFSSIIGLKSVKEIRELDDLDDEKLSDTLITFIGKEAVVDFNTASERNFAQRIRFV